ncbi:hypothetical protein GUITHDRAFT_160388 [Guillardia theta CCMP2712]|uniref:Uncharacterized protein n=1 Tax=Guillardia theta (strain CCMP2712) TaxID=905079 RepID=L1K2U2_GUITC|nr:hypothetical protein GUITHDRAFT_160388 [Guillardia theta CCMP2712]EKX55146.1 hypothetical protein GUITHDRAFT_160388 [Guillardia theta CCMP2712]|eukprot:XP_005842126.1 hypothetical protein GUITHDRAFT_160388 [Guillardia theta CCMP2712]
MDCSSWDGWLDLGVACGLDSQFDGLGADIGASDNSNGQQNLEGSFGELDAAILYTTPVVDEQHELKQAVDFSDAGIFLADDGLLHDDPGHAVDWSLIGSLSETRAVEMRTVPSHEEIEERLAYEPAPGGGDADMYATDQIEATGLPSAVPAGGSRPATARKGQQRWMRTTRIIQEYRRQVLHNHELEEHQETPRDSRRSAGSASFSGAPYRQTMGKEGELRSYMVEDNVQKKSVRDLPDSFSFFAISVLNAHTEPVTTLGCVCGEDRYDLVSGSSGGQIRIWNLSQEPVEAVLTMSLNGEKASCQPAITSVCAEVGGRIWCGASDGTLSRFAVSGVQTLRKVQAHTSMINHVLVLRSCPVVATAGADFMIRVWDAFNMNLLVSYCGHSGPVDCLAECTKSFTLISSSSSDASIRAWSLLMEESDGEDEEFGDESPSEHEPQHKRESLLDAFDEDVDSDASTIVVRSRGPSSSLCAHLCDRTNPTSTGYITAEAAQRGVNLELYSDSASRPAALDYQKDVSEQWHIASTEICTENSCRYMLFQRSDGKYSIGPHMSHTVNRCDQEDLYIDFCIFSATDQTVKQKSGGAGKSSTSESFYYLESIRLNFRDIAKSKTVNSLPHLDVQDILKGLSLHDDQLRNSSYTTTCMNQDCCPTSMVLVNFSSTPLVMTGGLDGLLRLWTHQC